MKGQQAIGALVIFIALVISAALAAFVLTHTTQTLQTKALAVGEKTMAKSTTTFSARQVEGLTTTDDGNIEYVIVYLELAPGSDVIDLQDVSLIWSASGGTEYEEFSFAGTSTVDLNTAAIDTATPFGTPDLNNGKFYIVANRSSNIDDDNRYVEAGEIYALAIKLTNTLDEGEDWQITVRVPYGADAIIQGYAPDVLQKGQIVVLKSG